MKTNRVGIDLIEVKRVEAAVAAWGDRFLQRVFTAAEIKECGGRATSLAARFAAKEAMMKALGAGFDRVSWRDVEVVTSSRGEPRIRLSGRAKRIAGSLRISEIAVSLAHTSEHAIAYVHAARRPGGRLAL